MRPAAVVQGDDAAIIGGPLVGADTEEMTHETCDGQEEAAGRAGRVRLADTVGVRTVVAVVPPLGGPLNALGTEHAGAPEVELVQGDRVSLLPRGLPPRLEALVGFAFGQTVGAGDVAGADPVGPGHPGRGEEGVLPRQELQLADRRCSAPRRPRHGHRPPPAVVARQVALEEVGDQALGLQLRGRVLAHGQRLGDLPQRRPGPFDGGRRGQRPVLGGRGALGPGRQGARPLDGGDRVGRAARSGGARGAGHGRCICRCVHHVSSVGGRFPGPPRRIDRPRRRTGRTNQAAVMPMAPPTAIPSSRRASRSAPDSPK